MSATFFRSYRGPRSTSPRMRVSARPFSRLGKRGARRGSGAEVVSLFMFLKAANPVPESASCDSRKKTVTIAEMIRSRFQLHAHCIWFPHARSPHASPSREIGLIRISVSHPDTKHQKAPKKNGYSEWSRKLGNAEPTIRLARSTMPEGWWQGLYRTLNLALDLSVL